MQKCQDDAQCDTEGKCKPTQPGNRTLMNSPELVGPIDGADP